MTKGPLVYAAFLLAVILIAMSFLLVAMPDYVETIGAVAGVAAVLVIVVLVLILVRTRRSA